MLHIRRILFPTDLSDGARRAFSQAASLAERHNAELHILNVRAQNGTDDTFPVSNETLDEWLGEASDGRPDLGQIQIIQKQVEASAPTERILAYAEDADIDLVVMGTHGRRGVHRMLMGSVTEEVVRKAPCPVLSVPLDTETPPEGAIRRILVPVDFSEASEAAVFHAKEIARTYDADLDLLHVVEETLYPSAYGVEPAYFPTEKVLARVERGLGEMARREIGEDRVSVKATIGYAPTTILDYVTANDIDLIVIATHGRTGIDRVLLGSVAARVLRRAPRPVFVVKPDRKSLVPADQIEAAAAES